MTIQTQATNNVEDFSHSTRLLGATTLRWWSYNFLERWSFDLILRNVLGTKCLAEILSERYQCRRFVFSVFFRLYTGHCMVNESRFSTFDKTRVWVWIKESLREITYKYSLQFGQIHFAIWNYIFCNQRTDRPLDGDYAGRSNRPVGRQSWESWNVR